jgi:hypothetical protein
VRGRAKPNSKGQTKPNMARRAASLVVWSICLILCTARTNNNYDTAAACVDGSYAVKLPPFGPCSGYRSCEPGFYCVDGKKFLCPEGTYGDAISLNSSRCSGPCPPGFFCPSGTVHSYSHMCGDASVFCPESSSSPHNVSLGYYTVDAVGSDEPAAATTRVRQVVCPRGHYCEGGIKYLCPGGTYGSAEGQSSSICSGVCPEGWYCPVGSVQPFQFSCISAHNAAGGRTATLYCPEGSTRPLHTAQGYYAVSPHFEEGGGFGGQKVCPRGSYCIEGMRHLCPAGRYGAHKQNSNASCSGLCTAGYFCGPGSVTDMQDRCPDAASYCPIGSPAPVLASTGYYTSGHDPVNYTFNVANYGGSEFAETARTNQTLCEPGFYCLADGKSVPCC